MKDVLIKIKGISIVEGDKNVVELTTTGSFHRRKGDYIIRYTQAQPDEPDPGKTTLTVSGSDVVTISRRGKFGSNLTIEAGKRHQCLYDTGFGELMMGVSDAVIDSKLGTAGGDLSFKYTLDIDATVASENEVFINIREC